MNNIRRSVCLLVAALAMAGICAAQCTKSGTLKLNERYLRRRAQIQLLPHYPPAALKAQAQGVVVAWVQVDTKGIVNEVTVIQSPSPMFDQITKEAFRKWRFKPIVTPTNEVVCARSKLTLYFFIENGRGRVDQPKIFGNRVS